MKPILEYWRDHLKKRKIELIPPNSDGDMIGAGISHKGNRYITHTDLHHEHSAVKTFYVWQRLLAIGILSALFIGLIVDTRQVATIFVAIITTIYFIDVLFNAYLILKSLHIPPELHFTEKEMDDLDPDQLPTYTILCPLYKESEVLPNFAANMSGLDWPKDKLEVLLLLEADDSKTIETAKSLKLPSYFKILIVPHSFPKTKPKACNYGLSHSHGEFLVIYDAEDKPEPYQLKKAYLGFRSSPNNVACLQAKLNYFNPHDNLLTRLFTAEYSLWFDVILPGLQSIKTTIPLGGTSNHFQTKLLKELRGWDAFNVTEDADLGTRLFKLGYRTAIIDSTTLEEANSNLGNWIRQRSRWIKGYMQTFLVHNRNPRKLIQSHGVVHSLIFQLLMGGKIAFMLINPILWVITISYFALYWLVGPSIEKLYPPLIFYMGAFSLVVGNFLCLYYYMIGCAKRGHFGLIKYVFFIPFYWLMISIAAVKAITQLMFKPHYWEKTNHGLNLQIKKEIEANEIATGGIRGFTLPQWSGSAFLVLAALFANILNFLYNIFLSKNLSLEQFGVLSLFGSFLYISQIFISPFSSIVTRISGLAFGKYREPIKNILINFQNIGFKTGLVMSAVWLVSIPWIKQIFNSFDNEPFYIFTPVWVIGVLAAVNSGYLSGNQRFGVLAIIGLVESVSKLGITVLIVLLGLNDMVYFALPISMYLAFLISWQHSTRTANRQTTTQTERVRIPIKFTITNVVNRLSTIVFLGMDVVIAKIILDPVDAGRFAILSLIGKMVYFFGSLANQFITPIVSKEEGAQRNPIYIFNRLLIISFFVSTISYVGVGLMGKWTVPILLGSRADEIIPYLSFYILGIAAFTVANTIILYHQTRNNLTVPLLGFMFSLAQIAILGSQRQTLATFTYTYGVMGVMQLLVSMGLHRLTNYSTAITLNTYAFFDLFKKRKNKVLSSSKQIRFLILNWRDGKHTWAGGAEVYIEELAKHFVKEGHDVTIFCGNDGNNTSNEVVDKVQIIRRGGFFTVYIWAAIYYVFRFHDQFDVIIDCENGIPFFTPLYSRRPKFLLIHHIHQKYFRENLSFPMKQVAGFLEGVLMPLVYRNEKVITVSESSKKDILGLHFFNKKNVSIVNPGIKLPKLKSVPKKSAVPTVVYVGRLRQYKNIDVAIRAFNKVLVKHPEAIFKIGGSGESEKSLKLLVKELSIGKSVKFFGHITDEQRTKLYSSAWIMVQASSIEGWGITVIEANACGTPVVASNVSGLKDSVINGKTGKLVKMGDISAFSTAINSLIENKAVREKMSKQALIRAQNFGWENNSSEFLSEIRKELKEKYNFELGEYGK